MVTVPPVMIWAANTARPVTTPFVGGMGPVNMPVRESILGSAAFGLSVAPPAESSLGLVIEPAAVWPAVWRGVAVLSVVLGDSSELGPERSEFTSNAVTA